MKPIYSNDRKAPRMRKGKFSKMVITKELFTKFKKAHPAYKTLTWAEFFQAWLDIAETIRMETVTNPLGTKLGSYMGELKVQYLPYKFQATNHSLSTELGEKVTHTNLAAKGKIPKIKWERRDAVKRNKILQFYAFDPTREINRLANKHLEGKEEQVRIARNTLGGHSVWRTKMRKK